MDQTDYDTQRDDSEIANQITFESSAQDNITHENSFAKLSSKHQSQNISNKY